MCEEGLKTAPSDETLRTTSAFQILIYAQWQSDMVRIPESEETRLASKIWKNLLRGCPINFLHENTEGKARNRWKNCDKKKSSHGPVIPTPKPLKTPHCILQAKKGKSTGQCSAEPHWTRLLTNHNDHAQNEAMAILF